MIAYLGACVDRVTNIESTRPVEQHAIEQVALSAAVHAGDGEHSNRALQRLQKLACLLIDLEFCTDAYFSDKGNPGYLLPTAGLKSTKGSASS